VSEGGAPDRPRPASYPGRGEAAVGIVRTCRRLWQRGLVAGPDGNVSVRLADDRILVTGAGLSKGELTTDDLVELRLDGTMLGGTCRASSEVRMHLRIYEVRPDVGAVVHAHPPTATGLAVAGEDLMTPVLPEIILQLGGVPRLPFVVPGGEELAGSVAAAMRRHDAVLLANHGATTVGPTLLVAHQRMESVEHAARIILTARLAGRVTELTPEQRRALAAWPGAAATP
jgi:L-fuculose-phosphate aldolase